MIVAVFATNNGLWLFSPEEEEEEDERCIITRAGCENCCGATLSLFRHICWGWTPRTVLILQITESWVTYSGDRVRTTGSVVWPLSQHGDQWRQVLLTVPVTDSNRWQNFTKWCLFPPAISLLSPSVAPLTVAGLDAVLIDCLFPLWFLLLGVQ